MANYRSHEGDFFNAYFKLHHYQPRQTPRPQQKKPHHESVPTRRHPLPTARQGGRRSADYWRRGGDGPVRQAGGGGGDRPDRDLQLGPLPHGGTRFFGWDDALRRCECDRDGHGARGASRRDEDARFGRCLRDRPVSTDAAVLEGGAGSGLFGACKTFRRSACSMATSAWASKRPGWATGWKSI